MVVPEWRGRGVATALPAESLGVFRSRGMAEAALTVDIDNPTGAFRLYRGLGFDAKSITIRLSRSIASKAQRPQPTL